MTLAESFELVYAWALGSRREILLASALIPVVGTALARLGKGGRTDKDGRLIANFAIGTALGACVVEIGSLFVAAGVLRRSILDADLALLAAPVLCLGGCIVGLRWVFPLGELGAVRSFIDVAVFVAACAGVVWLFSKFRGWGILFFGSIGEMLVIGALGLALLRRLYRRAVGSRAPAERAPEGPVPSTETR